MTRLDRLTGYSVPRIYIRPTGKKWRTRGGDLFFSGGQQRQAGEIVGTFVLIETDEGVTGVCPGGYGPQGHVITHNLKPLIVGEDPFRVEKLWDMVYRSQVLGRSGVIMMAISVLDCALWGPHRENPRRDGVQLFGRSHSRRDACVRQRSGLFG